LPNGNESSKEGVGTRRKYGTVETEVIAQLPLKVDLTKTNSGNDLRFTVKSGGELLGTLQMGRGSVRWYEPKVTDQPTFQTLTQGNRLFSEEVRSQLRVGNVSRCLPEDRVQCPFVDVTMKHNCEDLPRARDIAPQLYVASSL
jgi:hypothetical protein